MAHDIIELFPEVLPREQDSVFRRYIEAHEEELTELDNAREQIKLEQRIDSASGDDLDRIGRMFGQVGQRLGRTDDAYRQYLKSVVQAFAGRGIDWSMRQAFAAAFDIDSNDIEITEDTTNVEYTVHFYDWIAHDVNNHYAIADLVDPSGVEQANVRYYVDSDIQQSSDTIETLIRPGTSDWDASDWDTMGWT